LKRTLLRDAQVITMAPTRPDAEWVDILVEDDYIAQVGNHLVADDAEIVDLAGAL
jgi:predicted amidohydrolase YtcJ